MLSVDKFSNSDDDVAVVMDGTKSFVSSSLKSTRNRLRLHSNPFELSDAAFVRHFRMSKAAFRYVLNEITDESKPVRSSAVPQVLKLATTLSVISHGGYQEGAGKEFNLGLAQPTVCKCVKEIIDAIETVICPKWIKFHMDDAEQMEAKLYFYEKTGFPGIIGCVDSTHIRIQVPSKTDLNVYLNSKRFHSLNAMIVCDHQMRIRYIDARHPGASNDANAWNLSELREVLKQKFENGKENTWLLADEAYPLEPYLMTPFGEAAEGSCQRTYNEIHASALEIMEQTIFLLKNRFRCLLGAQPLQYKPQKVTQIVNVCAALHNICLHYGDADIEEVTTVESVDAQIDENVIHNETEVAVKIRNEIMYSIIDFQKCDS